MKNSSRFDATIAANLARSSSGLRGVGGFLEHALVEREPRQLAVEERRLERGTLGAHESTPAPAITTRRPNTSVEHVGAAAATSRSIVRSPVPSSAMHSDSPSAAADLLHLLQMLGVERVGEPQNRRELVHAHPILAVKPHVRQVRLLRHAAAMVAGDVRDDLHVVA